MEKRISPTELKYNFILVAKERRLFPPVGEVLEYEGHNYSARVDQVGRLRQRSGNFLDLDTVFRVGDFAVPARFRTVVLTEAMR